MNKLYLVNSLILGVFCSLIIAVGSDLQAEELTYRPVNPSFGGAALNGSFLMNNATSQRPERKRRRGDPIDEFNDNIQASILNRISRDVADRILGEEAESSGSFSVGGTNIDFDTVGGEVVINIFDSANGGTTTIKVPAPTF